MPGSPTVTVFVLVEAGSKYEKKEENGISHFLEHMCFKGTTKRPGSSDISTELDAIGASYNAFTSSEYTGYYAKAQYEQVDKVLDIVSDMYLNPTLPQIEIDKEKGVIIEEINMYEDLPQRKVQDVFGALLYGDQPAGRTVLGPKENIKRFSREDFVKYRDAHYVAEATTVIVAGNFSEAKVLSSIKKIFKEAPTREKAGKEKIKEEQTKPEISLFKKDTDQAHLVLGFRTFDLYDKRNRIMQVLLGVLDAGMSSRLFKKLRDEMGVCYYVSAYHDTLTDHGVLQVNAGVDMKRIREVVVVILDELRKLKLELVGPEELNRTKNNLIGSMFLGLETSNSLANFYGFQEIVRDEIKTPEMIKAEIESVTAEEIKELANQIFVNEGLNLAVIGRFEDKHEFEDVLKI